ncbi:MAG: J domain-containing protein [Desulfomonilia bacterium]|jgi:molecular chaperone DnaJ
MAKDYYEVLGVPRNASAKQIKEAYRRLSRKWHPDINPGNREAEERFKEISSAYDVLGDEERRRLYDEFGEEGLRPGFDAERARDYRQGFRGASRRAQAGAGPGGGWSSEGFGRFSSYEDIFGNVFDIGPGGRASREQEGGRDLEHELTIDLVSALKGFQTEIAIDRPKACPTCRGSGLDPRAEPSPCPVCGGTGRLDVSRGPIQFTRACPHCGGTGRMGSPCPACRGQGVVTGTERIRVTIPPGVAQGSRIRVPGKGEPSLAGGPPGDLYLVVHVRDHPFLKRENDDLTMEVPVTVGEAMAGGPITVPTLDGPIRVKVPPGSQGGRVLKIRGKGAPNPKTKRHGDLLIRLAVRVPSTDDPEALEAARKMDRLYNRDVREGLKL